MMKGSTTQEMTREQIDRAAERMTFRSAKRLVRGKEILADRFVDAWVIGTEPDIYAAEYRSRFGDRLYVEFSDRGPERAKFYYADRVIFFRRCGAVMTRATEWSYRFGWGPARKIHAMLAR